MLTRKVKKKPSLVPKLSQVLKNPKLAFSWYLLSCFLYYKQSICILTDDEFDHLSKYILSEWNNFDHMHKHLICIDDLQAGTGYAIKYPLIVEHSAMKWYFAMSGNSTTK